MESGYSSVPTACIFMFYLCFMKSMIAHKRNSSLAQSCVDSSINNLVFKMSDNDEKCPSQTNKQICKTDIVLLMVSQGLLQKIELNEVFRVF